MDVSQCETCDLPNTWTDGDKICIDCPMENICLGGYKCAHGRVSTGCALCASHWYSNDGGETCIPCPPTDFWGAAFSISSLIVFYIIASTAIEETKEEGNNREKNGKKNKEEMADEEKNMKEKEGDETTIHRSQSKGAFEDGMAKSSHLDRTRQTVMTVFTIVCSHLVTLSLTIDSLNLASVPDSIRDALTFVVKLASLNIFGVFSAPDCSWNMSIFEK